MRGAEQVRAPEPTYYLALGDSLAQGVQPNASGVSVMTRDGYPDQAYAALRASRPGLKLVKLGCPGETTTSMINGGICRYRGGSQLAATVAFISHQNPANSPDRASCDSWLITLFLKRQGIALHIRHPRPGFPQSVLACH